MFISKQDTIIENSVSEQLSSNRLKQKENQYLQNSSGKNRLFVYQLYL